MTLDPTTPITVVHPSPVPPPASVTSAAAPGPGRETLLGRFGRDLLYVLVGFPVALASFTAMVTGLSVAGSLVIVLIGLPLLWFTLVVARLFAVIERGRLRLRGDVLAPVRYRQPTPGLGRMRRLLERLSDPQAWLEVAHGLVAFPVALATWCVAVVWTSTTLGCLSYPIWGRYLPADTADNQTPAELLHLGISNTVIYLAVGAFGALTIIPIIRACATVQAGLARTMLSNEHVAELQQRVLAMRANQAAVADADVDSRRRIERDIHDGPQQRLVRLGMDLALAERRLAEDPESARQLLAEARAHASTAVDELRLLSRGIAPPLLADRGLGAALADVASRCSVPVDLDLDLGDGERLPSRVESAVYFTVAEALTNVAKHARAEHVRVAVRRVDRPVPVVRAWVVDDGRGGADLARGHGLAGLRERLVALDGTLSVSSPLGGPTTLAAEVPCGS